MTEFQKKGNLIPMNRGPRTRSVGCVLLAGLLTIVWIGVPLPGEDGHDGHKIHVEHSHGPHHSTFVYADYQCAFQLSPCIPVSMGSVESIEYQPSRILDLPVESEHISDHQASARASPRAPPLRGYIIT